jgi:hypothetical protein
MGGVGRACYATRTFPKGHPALTWGVPRRTLRVVPNLPWGGAGVSRYYCIPHTAAAQRHGTAPRRRAAALCRGVAPPNCAVTPRHGIAPLRGAAPRPAVLPCTAYRAPVPPNSDPMCRWISRSDPRAQQFPSQALRATLQRRREELYSAAVLCLVP